MGAWGLNNYNKRPYFPDQQSSGDNGDNIYASLVDCRRFISYTTNMPAKTIFTDVDKFARTPINVISNAIGRISCVRC